MITTNITQTGNRCHRCNRKLKDQTALYGWRCAEIVGISDSLNSSGNETFNAYMHGFQEAFRFLKENNIDTSSIDLKKFMTSYAKQSIALSMYNTELGAPLLRISSML